MNLDDEKHAQFGLVRDMLATPEIIRNLDCDRAQALAESIAGLGRLMLTGEGSSRIFPAKSLIAHGLRKDWPLVIQTEGGTQAYEYDLGKYVVFAASNSGKTAEVIRLVDHLQTWAHPHRYSLTAHADTPLQELAMKGYVLTCGEEGAVAATKSVVEQALFYRAMAEHAVEQPKLAESLPALGDAFEEALKLEIPEEIVTAVTNASTIYWAGRNDGVAEELTLKTNEITRKPADFLEGTYAVHGIEEVMTADDVVIWIDPDRELEEKFQTVLADGVGLKVVAIASRDTSFPTLQIPDVRDLSAYVQMAAGWNLLVEVGVALGIDIDKPERARKVGNEYTG